MMERNHTGKGTEVTSLPKPMTERTHPYHPLVYKILYAKLKTSCEVIKEECKLDKNGEIDVEWLNSLDDEQLLRIEIASYIQNYFNQEDL